MKDDAVRFTFTHEFKTYGNLAVCKVGLWQIVRNGLNVILKLLIKKGFLVFRLINKKGYCHDRCRDTTAKIGIAYWHDRLNK